MECSQLDGLCLEDRTGRLDMKLIRAGDVRLKPREDPENDFRNFVEEKSTQLDGLCLEGIRAKGVQPEPGMVPKTDYYYFLGMRSDQLDGLSLGVGEGIQDPIEMNPLGVQQNAVVIPEGYFNHSVQNNESYELQESDPKNAGDIQLCIEVKQGKLKVELIRARRLKQKPGFVVPAPYVKMHLINRNKCIEKKKSALARRTRHPLFMEGLEFDEDCKDCILQVTVWGSYTKYENKVFMGITKIELDQLNLHLSDYVISWYKLFAHSSLVHISYDELQNSLSSEDVDG